MRSRQVEQSVTRRVFSQSSRSAPVSGTEREMDSPAGTRRRHGASSVHSGSSNSSNIDPDERHVASYAQVCPQYNACPASSRIDALSKRDSFQSVVESRRTSSLVAATLTLLAFLTRFYKINNPDEVV